MEKLPGPYSLDGDWLCKTMMHTSPIGITDSPSGLPFKERSSLKNFKCAAATLKASKKKGVDIGPPQNIQELCESELKLRELGTG